MKTKTLASFLLALVAAAMLASCDGWGYRAPTPKPPADFYKVDALVPDQTLGYPSISEDGRYLAVATGKDATPQGGQLLDLYLMDLVGREILLKVEGQAWSSIALSPQGDRLLAGSNYIDDDLVPYGRADLIKVADGSVISQIGVLNPAWSSDGQRLAAPNHTAKYTDPDRHLQIHILEVSSGSDTIVFDMQSERGFVSSLEFSPAEDLLAFVAQWDYDDDQDDYGELYVLDLHTEALHQLTEGWMVITPQFTAEGDRILFVGSPEPYELGTEFDLYVVDLQGKCHFIESPVPRLQGAALSLDGKTIALDTYYGVLVTHLETDIGEEFWKSGSPCREPLMR